MTWIFNSIVIKLNNVEKVLGYLNILIENLTEMPTKSKIVNIGLFVFVFTGLPLIHINNYLLNVAGQSVALLLRIS
jgi:hypothetical protein